MSANLPDEIWDGNGGRIEARSLTDRELVLVLHTKFDALKENVDKLEERVTPLERAEQRRTDIATVAGRWRDRVLTTVVALAAGGVGTVLLLAFGSHS